MKLLLSAVIFSVSSISYAAPSLNDAFQEALQASESDHQGQQTTLNVSPDQIVKAKFKRKDDVHVVTIEDNMMRDTFKPLPKKVILKPRSDMEMSLLQSELHQ